MRFLGFGSQQQFFGTLSVAVVVLIVGLAAHFIVTAIQKRRPEKWEAFQNKVDNFNERNAAKANPKTKEFFDEHVNDAQTKYVKYIVDREEAYQKDREEQRKAESKDSKDES